MKVDLDRIEVEALLNMLGRRVRKRWIHRWVNPHCRLCKNEIITIDKLNNALGGLDE